MRCKMSNHTLLETPYWNIPNRELITRVKSSQIRQDLAAFTTHTRMQSPCVAGLRITIIGGVRIG